jgi:hypothetical protein
MLVIGSSPNRERRATNDRFFIIGNVFLPVKPRGYP